jgi:hypothetical protein
MKEEKQRIAIAEACGYKQQPTPDGLVEWLGPNPDRCYIGRFRPDTIPSAMPDYLNDLNAMHEAEKVLQQHMAKWWNYTSQLAAANSALGTGGEAHATAKQRAEAFLRTIGKWEETE